MQPTNRKLLVLALAIGVAFLAVTGLLMAQGASQPVKSETQYFVTGEGDEAHLWVREGTNLRCVGHGECKAHDHDDHGDDHKKEK
ncbi:MAG: hypothetical protein L0Z55_05300 [Planctomycetes bacterium]|nr:hypothetical protein [Planctomycetota bacterium]